MYHSNELSLVFLGRCQGLRISQNSVTTNFVEFTFFALGCIRLVALLEVRAGLGCRDGSNVPEEGPGVLLRGSGPSSMRPGDSRRASAPPDLDDLGSVRP